MTLVLSTSSIFVNSSSILVGMTLNTSQTNKYLHPFSYILLTLSCIPYYSSTCHVFSFLINLNHLGIIMKHCDSCQICWILPVDFLPTHQLSLNVFQESIPWFSTVGRGLISQCLPQINNYQRLMKRTCHLISSHGLFFIPWIEKNTLVWVLPWMWKTVLFQI